jgi:A/G-specific adenine glycosylase
LTNPHTVSLADEVVAWQKQHGRHDLPWQNTTNAYRIWLSEVMLQQTQVATVIDYYQRFLARFPTIASLASAPLDDVITLWSGLGYYSRARNLHRCAQEVIARFDGVFPSAQSDLMTLPGIGRSTAAAISAFAYGHSAAILDGNVKRVFCRVFGVEGYPGKSEIDKLLWELAEREKPHGGVEAYTQGLMDLGATRCQRSKPRCADCPLQTRCVAFKNNLTAELPTRKPKKITPIKYACFWLAITDGKILLERRPPTGIWGGLWCLPQMSALTESESALTRHVEGASPRVGFEHGFTHFKMHARVLELVKGAEIKCNAVVALSDDSTKRWVAFDELSNYGLPAPIRIYLQSVFVALD